MGRLSLPHFLDFYMPGVGGGSPTLAKANVAGYVELLTMEARVRWQDVSKSPLARVWLEPTSQAVAADGMLIFWRDQGTWWTLRGAPERFDSPGQEHIEVMAAANTADALFTSAATAFSLVTQFASASSITAVRVEISTVPDFSTLVINAYSANDLTGWFYANNGVWSAFPAGGLPPLATQTVGYQPTGLLPLQRYYVRWTPYAGPSPGSVQLGMAGT